MRAGTALSPIIERIAVLSEPARLRALCVLERAELSVGELARVLQSPQSTVSRHLKLLAGAGWVRSRSERTATYYRLLADDLAQPDLALWRLLRAQMDEGGELAADERRLAETLADRPSDSLSFFGRVAGAWDSVRGDLFGETFTAAALVGLVRPDWVVADIGCGTGNIADVLAPLVEKVIAVDRSGPMLDAARRRLAVYGNVSFAEGSAGALPLETAGVDAAVCGLVLHHIEDVEGALREAARILRTDRGGGVVLVIDMYAHGDEALARAMGHAHLGFEPGELAQMMEAVGLNRSRVVPLASGPAARGPGLFALAAWKMEHGGPRP